MSDDDIVPDGDPELNAKIQEALGYKPQVPTFVPAGTFSSVDEMLDAIGEPELAEHVHELTRLRMENERLQADNERLRVALRYVKHCITKKTSTMTYFEMDGIVSLVDCVLGLPESEDKHE